MSASLRTYRPFPVAFIVAAFLFAGSLLVSFVLPMESTTLTPREEVFVCYVALSNRDAFPETLTREELRASLSALDPNFADIADRITILSYKTGYGFFALKIKHAGEPSKTYSLDRNGVF